MQTLRKLGKGGGWELSTFVNVGIYSGAVRPVRLGVRVITQPFMFHAWGLSITCFFKT